MDLVHQIELGDAKLPLGLDRAQTVNGVSDKLIQAQFSKAIHQQQTATSNTDNSQSSNSIDKDAIDKQKLSKSFESMIISMMMKPMFAEFAESSFGKGVEADVYTTLFSDAIADVITERGNSGLGNYFKNINV